MYAMICTVCVVSPLKERGRPTREETRSILGFLTILASTICWVLYVVNFLKNDTFKMQLDCLHLTRKYHQLQQQTLARREEECRAPRTTKKKYAYVYVYA